MSKRICAHCGSEYEVERGLHNWNKLFRKPTLDDFISLFIIVMVIFAGWAYQHDTKVCRETLNNLDKICFDYMSSQSFVDKVKNATDSRYTEHIKELNSSVFQVVIGNETRSPS